MRQQQKQGTKAANWILALPVMLALALVPLIVTVKEYKTGLADKVWFANTENGVDLFLYWKGRALILLAAVMGLFLIFWLLKKGRLSLLWERLKRPEILCVVLYLLLAAVSAFLSEYRDFALFGSYEQWEGLNVLTAYVVLMIYAYVVLDAESMIRFVVYSLILGSFILGLIGVFQYLQMDFFRSDAGQVVMNLMSTRKMRYKFNFSDGWVYATLYNPNYVGSYVVLVLPLIVTAATMNRKNMPLFWNILAIVSTCLLTITLLGSQSLTGCVAVVVSLVFFAVYMWPRIVKAAGWKKIALGAAGIAAFVIALCFLFPEEIRFGMDKLFHPTEDYHVIQSMLDTDKGLEVTTVSGDTFYVALTGDAEMPVSMKEGDGTEIALKEDDKEGGYAPQDSRFENFRFYNQTVTADGNVMDAMRIFNPTINKEWTIVRAEDGHYQVFNAFHKLDELREIPAIGFEKNQHFGDKRGYIWSRTFPLLKDFLLIGSGPDTFTESFPNNDYVGKTNMKYDGVAVTKPHNMYLQIWVQTGLLSLLAFLGVFCFYFFSSLKLYYRRPLGALEQFGVAVMVGCFGYMVAGLANDSTVSVAPVYWGLLGTGMAVNALVKGKDTAQF